MLQDLRDAITSPEWAEGDSSVISDVANNIVERNSGDTNEGDLVKIFETLQDRFVQIAQLPISRGYSNTYPVIDVTRV